jgi:hypothetical protein
MKEVNPDKAIYSSLSEYYNYYSIPSQEYGHTPPTLCYVCSLT